MAMQAETTAAHYSPQVVGGAFVKQYYRTLRSSPQNVHRFYHDTSVLGRADSNGNMTFVTTLHDINVQIMSTDYTGYVIELETVDPQASHVGGVLILVTGSFTTPDAVKQKFTQSFFLAPQGNGGYFVLNDIFRFVPERPSAVTNDVLANHDNESTQSATLPAEPETASVQGNTVPILPSAENKPVNDVVTNPSANGVSLVKNDASAVTCVKVVPEDVEKMPGTAPTRPASAQKAATAPASAEKAAPTTSAEKAAPIAAPTASAPVPTAAPTASAQKAASTPASALKAAPTPATAEKDVTKKTYASIVKVMRESTVPAPAAKSKPRPKAVQNEKSASSPPKPAHATNTAPPGDKTISNTKSPDEPGYSIFVKNLPSKATVEMVEQEFRRFGAIKPGGIQVRNRQDLYCFGFVEFESQRSMQAAIEASSVYFGSWESYIEEKKTATRVVNGVITRGDDNGNAGGSRFQLGRGGYHGDNFRGRDNGNYRDGDNMRNGFRNQNDHSGRGQGQQGNGYHQNGYSYHQNRNGYHQNGNGYPPNGNGYQQRRPAQNGNGRTERANGPRQTPAAA